MVKVIVQRTLFQKTKDFFIRLGSVKTVSLAFVLILAGGFAVTLYQLGKPQEIRQRASEIPPSNALLAARKTIGINADGTIGVEKAVFLNRYAPGSYQYFLDHGLIPNPTDIANKAASLSPTSLTTSAISTSAAALSPTITSCGSISQPGTYKLAQDITNSDPNNADCIDVENTSNVTIDCQNHKINSFIGILFNYSPYFIAQNCVFNDPPDLSQHVDIAVPHSPNGKILNNISKRGAFNIDSSDNIIITNNYIAKGMIILNTLTNATVTQNTFDASPDNVSKGALGSDYWAAIITDRVTNSTISKNTISAIPRGADDAIVLMDSSGNTVSENTISNMLDAGIETLGYIENTKIINNHITNALTAAISSYWGTSWLNNIVSGNTIDSSYYQFLFFRYDGFSLAKGGVPQTAVYFKDNTFSNNITTNPKTFYGDDITNVLFDFATLAPDITPDKLFIGNNTFTNNNFGSLYYPIFNPSSMIVNGGGNICKTPPSNIPNPLNCTITPTPTPTPTPAPLNQKPTITNVTINPQPITANGSSQYTVTFSATDPDGGADIVKEVAYVNVQGVNAGAYRGALAWTSGNWYSPVKSGTSPILCSGNGGYGQIDGTYGPSYVNLASCVSNVAGNVRTSVFTVTFNPVFTTPTTSNTLTGLVYDTKLNADGWKAFDTFSLAANMAPPPTPTPTLRPTPTICVPPAPICIQYKSPGVCNDNGWSYPPNPCVNPTTLPSPTPTIKLQSGAVCTLSSQCASGICNYINNTSGTCQ